MNAAPQPIRVYYNTRRPYCISADQMFDGPFTPADFEAVVVIDNLDGALTTAEDIFARLNQDERPGGRSFRAMSVGDVAEIGGRLQQCLPFGWRNVSPDDVNALRERFGINTSVSKEVQQPIRFTLQDVDGSGRTQDVLIFLSEHVEIVVPQLGQSPGVMDPDNELAVARVELMDGDVRAMIWDRETIKQARESLVVTLTPVGAPTKVGP